MNARRTRIDSLGWGPAMFDHQENYPIYFSFSSPKQQISGKPLPSLTKPSMNQNCCHIQKSL